MLVSSPGLHGKIPVYSCVMLGMDTGSEAGPGATGKRNNGVVVVVVVVVVVIFVVVSVSVSVSVIVNVSANARGRGRDECENQTLEVFVAASHFYANFDCPVTHQNVSL